MRDLVDAGGAWGSISDDVRDVYWGIVDHLQAVVWLPGWCCLALGSSGVRRRYQCNCEVASRAGSPHTVQIVCRHYVNDCQF